MKQIYLIFALLIGGVNIAFAHNHHPISEAIIDSFEHPISSIHIRVEEDCVKLDIQ